MGEQTTSRLTSRVRAVRPSPTLAMGALSLRLKEAGKIRVEGKTKGARWFLDEQEQQANN